MAAPKMTTEREYQINPIVQESVAHNTKTFANLQNVTASLFGVAAGILGLESYSGFIVYFAFAFLVTGLFYLLRIAPSSLAAGQPVLSTTRFFRRPTDFWVGGVFSGLPGFILTWTLFYGIVRA